MSADEVMDLDTDLDTDTGIEADAEDYRQALEATAAIINKLQDLAERAGIKDADPIQAFNLLVEERNKLKYEASQTRAKIAVRLAQDAADQALRPFVAELVEEEQAFRPTADPIFAAFLLGRVDGADRLLFAFERRWEETAEVRTKETFDAACAERMNRTTTLPAIVATPADVAVAEKPTPIEAKVTPLETEVVLSTPIEAKVTFSTPTRRYLPDTRGSITRKITLRHLNRDNKIEELDIYVSVGLYDDGTPGEIFLKAAKAGDTISGFLDALGVCISIGIQYGAPLSAFLNKLKGMRFEPSGTVVNEAKSEGLNNAGSIVDAFARWIENRFLPKDPG